MPGRRGNVAALAILAAGAANTSPDEYFSIEQMQLMRFNGQAWELFGDVITGEVGHERSQ